MGVQGVDVLGCVGCSFDVVVLGLRVLELFGLGALCPMSSSTRPPLVRTRRVTTRPQPKQRVRITSFGHYCLGWRGVDHELESEKDRVGSVFEASWCPERLKAMKAKDFWSRWCRQACARLCRSTIAPKHMHHAPHTNNSNKPLELLTPLPHET